MVTGGDENSYCQPLNCIIIVAITASIRIILNLIMNAIMHIGLVHGVVLTSILNGFSWVSCNYISWNGLDPLFCISLSSCKLFFQVWTLRTRSILWGRVCHGWV